MIGEWLFPKKCLGCTKGERYLCNFCERKQKRGGFSRDKQFEGIISVYKYDGVIKEIVEAIKYEFVREAAEEMGKLMAKKIKLEYPATLKKWQKEKYVMVPIPLYWQRKNWRGFNQAEELAKSAADKLGLEMVDNFLERKVKSKNQAEIRGRRRKLDNLKGVFESQGKVNLKRIILVDDVITSGATMSEALKCVRKQYPRTKLWALSLAGGRR